MKPTKMYISLFTALFVIPLSHNAYSANFGNSPALKNECGFGLDMDTFHKLDLTNKQKVQLANLELVDRNVIKEELVKGRKVRQAYRIEIQKLLLAKKLDERAANQLTHKMADSQAYLNLRVMEQQHAMFDLLTDKQKADYIQLENKKASQCRS
ncbi:Spy/CpxP family protein refolding chaperone [Vibrio marisflavi]|uniref:Uncharacterized protein n=1 Tax=Vibrio marisflavi CECT 7928 TaxID=634439 RepID=A0ABM9A8Y2_9VIBR|nr:Spy/CpxP family protein refolding chaperone [Vibrio marisflavi]CAH0542809.1 hypothetical protein VMF7928_04216 [Vibrio marisflavi CECT 7928]